MGEKKRNYATMRHVMSCKTLAMSRYEFRVSELTFLSDRPFLIFLTRNDKRSPELKVNHEPFWSQTSLIDGRMMLL
jgi:hypothetical protein